MIKIEFFHNREHRNFPRNEILPHERKPKENQTIIKLHKQEIFSWQTGLKCWKVFLSFETLILQNMKFCRKHVQKKQSLKADI